MSLVTKAVEANLENTLPDKFAIVIDGWTKHSTHFIGVFASFSNVKEPNFYETVLLSFSPLQSETSFSAKDHYDYIEWVLQLYGKTFENVMCICG